MVAITSAVDRALVDHKVPCKVVNALRIDWLKGLRCPIALTFNNASATAGVDDIANETALNDFTMYDTIFDDFHYDIGHGKGLGEGSVDSADVTDGFGAGFGAPRGAQGDSQS